MKSYFQLAPLAAIVGLGSLAVVSCKNPADETTDATVSGEKAVVSQGSGSKFVFSQDSKIGFVGSKVTGSHSGGFKDFSGHFFVKDGEDKPNAGAFTIQMDSTWSDNEKLTGHLKADDFFGVETYPTATFEMTDAKKMSDNNYQISGNLELHGVTKNITFPVTAERSGDTIKFQSEFDINRKDFGINYPGKTDDLIRDEVVLNLDFVAQKES